jgi:hypothetical protein
MVDIELENQNGEKVIVFIVVLGNVFLGKFPFEDQRTLVRYL